MIFKGQVIASTDSSYDGKKGRQERRTLTCLDAEPVKLINTVDVQLTGEQFRTIEGDPMGKTLEFDISNLEFFGGRIRMVGTPRVTTKTAAR
jgi:hypothetical protein